MIMIDTGRYKFFLLTIRFDVSDLALLIVNVIAINFHVIFRFHSPENTCRVGWCSA